MHIRRAIGVGVAVALAGVAQTSQAGSYDFKALHLFCQEKNCTDGAMPLAPLLRDGSGALYGTTSQGGAFNNGGTVFAMAPNGEGYDYKVLYSFCHQAGC